MTKIIKVPTGPYHPGYGCAIFIIMILTFSGILTWAAYTFFKQDKEIAAFTQETVEPFPKIEPTDAEKAALEAKLKAFSIATGKNEAADLSLSVPEMNDLLVFAAQAGIGGQEGSLPYIDILRFRKLLAAEKRIVTDIHLPMNKLPWKEGKRFLVGTAIFEPMIDEKTAFEVKLETIDSPGKTINEGFMNNFIVMPWLSIAKQKPEISAALAKVSSFEITPDGKTLVLHATPRTQPPAPPTKPFSGTMQ